MKQLENLYTVEGIRRKDRILAEEDSLTLLRTGEYGILSTVSSDGQPYGVPLSYIVADDCIYFHSATEGHKIDNVLCNGKVSFTVIGKTEVIPQGFTTKYECVVVFGKASIVDDEVEKIRALTELGRKYCLPALDKAPAYIDKSLPKVIVIKIRIERITGKART